MAHNPRDNCYNTTASQFRYALPSTVDEFGGNVNAAPIRVRSDGEVAGGFACGLYPNETADQQIAGGPANVDHYTMYCDVRDIRQQDYVTSPLYPGRKMIVGTVRQHGGAGQITPFMVLALHAVREDAFASQPSPGVS